MAVLINAYWNFAKINQAPELEKFYLKLNLGNNLNFDNLIQRFAWDFALSTILLASISLIILILFIDLKHLIDDSISVVLIIKFKKTVVKLKTWIKC